MDRGEIYEVRIVPLGEQFYKEALEYIYRLQGPGKAENMARELLEMVMSLERHPNRGSKEKRLSNLREDFRFLLCKRTPRAEVKVIYYIDEKRRTVYVTDFFPTEMDDSKILGRNA